MAEFCYDCTRDVLGMSPTDNDFRGLVGKGMCMPVICEGCPPDKWEDADYPGGIFIDHNGKRIDFTALASDYTGPRRNA